MGGILDAHVEWAIVNRLRAMLDDPPETKFNVTQSFALFTSGLMWAKNRAWVAGHRRDRTHFDNDADKLAHDARLELGNQLICGDPWRLSQRRLSFARLDGSRQRRRRRTSTKISKVCSRRSSLSGFEMRSPMGTAGPFDRSTNCLSRGFAPCSPASGSRGERLLNRNGATSYCSPTMTFDESAFCSRTISAAR